MTTVSSSLLASILTQAVLPAARGAAGGTSALAAVAMTATEAATTADVQPQASASQPQTAKASASESTKKVLSQQELTKQVEALQAKMDKLNPALSFVLDHGSGRTLIQLTDRDTNEVIQQYPSQATLQISKALDQFQKGQLLSKLA